MNPNDPNVVMMELVAQRLGDGLREELVFVGGAVTGLLITDPAQPAILAERHGHSANYGAGVRRDQVRSFCRPWIQ